MELVVEMNSFCRWWKCKLMCDSCFATNPTARGVTDAGPNTYMDFTWGARWRDTVVDHEKYMQDINDVSPFHVIEGWRKEMTFRDFAHMDHLGYGRDLGGACLKSMLKRKELEPIDGPLDVKLRILWGELQASRKANGLPRVAGYLSPAGCGLDNM